MISAAILLKGLVAAIIVGFVTASIKTWVDRVFLVIMLVGIVGLPIGEAILVNLVVVGLAALGLYAIAVGLRILFIKPLPERETKSHIAWLAPVGLGSGFLAGFISAGGKPFAVPAYNNAMGHHPQRAYAFASLGVAAAAWSALATQVAFVGMLSKAALILALYEFVLVTAVALFVSRLWSQKLNTIMNLTIAPILILVGIKFIVGAIG